MLSQHFKGENECAHWILCASSQFRPGACKNVTLRENRFGWSFCGAQLPGGLLRTGRTRRRGRADCRLCRGNSTGTVAFTERLWRCHRCNEGGDVFSLVRAVNHCGFPEALRVVAGLAGVKLGRSSSAEIQATQHQHEQEEVAAAQWERQERMLRLEAREDIHALDRVKRLLSKHPDREDDELGAQLEAADTVPTENSVCTSKASSNAHVTMLHVLECTCLRKLPATELRSGCC